MSNTSIKVGDRVTGTFEGEVCYVNSNGSVDVRLSIDSDEEVQYVPVRHLTVLPQPLKVGSVLKSGDSARVPAHAMVIEELPADSNYFVRTRDGRWAGFGQEWGGGEARCADDILESCGMTIVYLPS